MHLSASREIKVTVSGGRGNRAVPGSPPKALPAHKSMPSVGSGAGGSFGGLSKTRSGLMSSPMAPLGGTSDEDDDTSEASPASSSGLINHQSSSFDDAFGRNLVDQYGDGFAGKECSFCNNSSGNRNESTMQLFWLYVLNLCVFTLFPLHL